MKRKYGNLVSKMAKFGTMLMIASTLIMGISCAADVEVPEIPGGGELPPMEGACLAVSNVKAEISADKKSVNVSWTNPDDPNRSGIRASIGNGYSDIDTKTLKATDTTCKFIFTRGVFQPNTKYEINVWTISDGPAQPSMPVKVDFVTPGDIVITDPQDMGVKVTVVSKGLVGAGTYIDPYLIYTDETLEVKITGVPEGTSYNGEFSGYGENFAFNKETNIISFIGTGSSSVSDSFKVSYTGEFSQPITSKSIYFKAAPRPASVTLSNLTVGLAGDITTGTINITAFDKDKKEIEDPVLKGTLTAEPADIIELKDRTVTPKKEGTATVTYKEGDVTASCTVTVIPNFTFTTDVKFTTKDTTLIVGDSITIEYTKEPVGSNSDITIYVDKSYEKDRVIIEGNKITGLKPGSVDIWAKWEDKDGHPKVAIGPTITVGEMAKDFDAGHSSGYLTVKHGSPYKLNVYAKPAGAILGKVTYTSKNPDIKVDAEGNVTTTKTSGLVKGLVTVAVEGAGSKDYLVGFHDATTGVYWKDSFRDVIIPIGNTYNPLDNNDFTYEPTSGNAIPNYKITKGTFDDPVVTDILEIMPDGSLKALKNGTVHVYLRFKNDSDGADYSAKNPKTFKVDTKASDFTLSDTNLELDYADEYQISLTAIPAGARYSKVTYSSSNPLITVSNTGVISTTATSDKPKGTITVTVDDLAPKTIDVQFLRGVTSIDLDQRLVVTGKTGTATVTPTIVPAENDFTPTWTSSDTSVAIVDNGKITVKTPGVATITIKSGNQSATTTVVALNTSDNFSFKGDSDLHKLGTEAGIYSGYFTDDASLIGYKYTTTGHADKTGLPIGTGKWDIIGYDTKLKKWQSSTYQNAGWGWKVNNEVVSLNEQGLATSGGLELFVKPVLVYDRGTPFVLFIQTLTNKGTTTLTDQKFGSGTDIQVAGNDYAPVEATPFGAFLKDEKTNMVFSMNVLSGEAVTPAKTMWVSSYTYGAMKNVYTDLPNSISAKDSAMAYSWQNIELKPGETKVFTSKLTFVVDKGGTLEGIVY